MSNNIQCHMSRSCSQTQIPVTKSETFSLLGNHQVGTSSTVKSDKRSLASKLSGTLNRTNSGKYRLLDKLTILIILIGPLISIICPASYLSYGYINILTFQSQGLTQNLGSLLCLKNIKMRKKIAFYLKELKSSVLTFN